MSTAPTAPPGSTGSCISMTRFRTRCSNPSHSTTPMSTRFGTSVLETGATRIPRALTNCFEPSTDPSEPCWARTRGARSAESTGRGMRRMKPPVRVCFGDLPESYGGREPGVAVGRLTCGGHARLGADAARSCFLSGARGPDGFTVSHRASRHRADAAGASSKSSLRASHEDQRWTLEWADLCPPTYDASPKRWTERANGSRNSHCSPTAPRNSHCTLQLALPPHHSDRKSVVERKRVERG